jgi:hypothetical protein
MIERQYQLLGRGWRVHRCLLLRLFSGRLIWRRDGRRAGYDTKTDQSGYGEIFHARFLLKFLERETNFRARYYFSFSLCSPGARQAVRLLQSKSAPFRPRRPDSATDINLPISHLISFGIRLKEPGQLYRDVLPGEAAKGGGI